jgi:Co/Zn/Cd efflux system component
MHTTDISSWQHTHHFNSANVLGERNTKRVLVLAAVMMVVEITTGWIFRSMALLADGLAHELACARARTHRRRLCALAPI